MTFNWPDIPFQGTEVTAFANAYKELAVEILNDYYDDLGPFGDIGELEVPYVEKAVVKDLLEEGILYASFIIQQRSGTSGPGTDFVLGNSPYDISDPDLTPSVLRLLGCKWDQQEASFQNNIKCGNQPDDDWTDDDPDQDKCCDGGTTLSEHAAIAAWIAWAGGPLIQNPFANIIGDAMSQYLSCDSTPITANNLSQSQLDRLKEIAQGEINAGRATEVTNTVSQSTRTRIGATKIFQVSFYRKTYSAHLLLGEAAVTTDANNNVLCIRDDFDFIYGVEADRSDGSYPGDPVTATKAGRLMKFPDGTCKDQGQVEVDPEYGGGKKREVVLKAATGCPGSHNGGCGGRGKPVPINICF
tara:strand:+ start:22 stop:1092 length:1071 start_codon:yes stop_codon:yes gene_type:complete